jgi:hypothetical protein
MPDKVDMSLDEIEEINKSTNRGGAARGRGTRVSRGVPRGGLLGRRSGGGFGRIQLRESGGPANMRIILLNRVGPYVPSCRLSV